MSKHRPWHPTAYDSADAYALKAIAIGTASADQQKRGLKWIIESACAVYEETYFPDTASDRDFAQGKRHVGLQIVKLLNMSSTLLDAKPADKSKGGR